MSTGAGANRKRGTTSVDRQIGARIRTRRLEIGMSQMKLAEALGVTFQQVQKYELGANRVSAATLLRIADALQTPLMSFFPTARDREAGSAALEDSEELIKLRVLYSKLSDKGRAVLVSTARAILSEEEKPAPSRKRRG